MTETQIALVRYEIRRHRRTAEQEAPTTPRSAANHIGIAEALAIILAAALANREGTPCQVCPGTLYATCSTCHQKYAAPVRGQSSD